MTHIAPLDALLQGNCLSLSHDLEEFTPVIRITDRTWQGMKSHGEAFETPDEFINRAVNSLEKSNTLRLRAAELDTEPRPEARTRTNPSRDHRGKLPQREFRPALMETVYELGGHASTAQMRPVMKRKMAGRLSEADYEPVSSGDPRWSNAICWERNDLVKEGLFRSDSPHGVWALTERGLAAAENAGAR